MTVQELIEKLEEMDPTSIIVLSSDPEGNSYAPSSDKCYSGFFVSKDAEFFDEADYFEMIDSNEDDEFEETDITINAGIPAVLLTPLY